MKVIMPLFPLSTAVLPGQRVSLHIFEDRYLQLLSDCMEGDIISPDKEFGVNYTSDDGLAAIGCSLSIVKIIKRFKDGRLDIVAVGKRRFRLCELIDGKPYQQGEIEFISEEESQPEASSTSLEFYKLHSEMCVVAGVKSPIEVSPYSPSFQSACAIGLDDFQKQTLLELASEQDRIAWLSDMYESILSQIKSGKNSLFNGLLADLKFGRDPGLQQMH